MSLSPERGITSGYRCELKYPTTKAISTFKEGKQIIIYEFTKEKEILNTFKDNFKIHELFSGNY